MHINIIFVFLWRGCHSSVDPSVPTILRPLVRSPSTIPSIFQFNFYVSAFSAFICSWKTWRSVHLVSCSWLLAACFRWLAFHPRPVVYVIDIFWRKSRLPQHYKIEKWLAWGWDLHSNTIFQQNKCSNDLLLIKSACFCRFAIGRNLPPINVWTGVPLNINCTI